MINNEFNLEDAFKRLNEINNLLEDPETTLKSSLELYSEGVSLANECKKSLEGMEKEIIILSNE